MDNKNLVDFKSYLDFTDTVALYPGAGERGQPELTYLILGLIGEVGETLTSLESAQSEDFDMKNALKEVGDCFWYLARLYEITKHEAFDVAFVFQPSSLVGGKVDGQKCSDQFLRGSDWAYHYGVKSIGEMANRYKKFLRKDDGSEDSMQNLKNDIAPICEVICITLCYIVYQELGEDLQSCLNSNIEKLSDRQDRGVLKGSGDNR